MGKVYTSVRGKEVDMEKLSLKNETTPAVGNAKMNARGDLLGPGGQVIKTREELMKDYYKDNPRAMKEDIPTRKK